MSSPLLKLSQDGIFPITCNEKGHLVSRQPATGYTIPGTIQGEGILAGTPSLFIRLAECNLSCSWKLPDGTHSECDTLYAITKSSVDTLVSPDTASNTIIHNSTNINHLVITGGEPLLQAEPLTMMCQSLFKHKRMHITLETNGTLFNSSLCPYISLFSISPKPGNTTPWQWRTTLRNIQRYIDICCNDLDKQFQIKIVVSSLDDENVIHDLLSQLNGWYQYEILIMPAGSTPESMAQSIPIALKMCIKNGWRYAPRLHIDLFGNRREV